MSKTVQELEKEIFELMGQLKEARRSEARREVPNYSFKTIGGEVSLLSLFGEGDTLLAVHNMGQGCRYCTLWADGFNGFVSHLEDALKFVVLSKDSPETQRQFANNRGWRFNMASHEGTEYLKDQSVSGNGANTPGVVCYQREGDKIFRAGSSFFGPGDIYCSMWSLLNLAGLDESTWTPQFRYWKRPEKMDDGGADLNE